MVPYTVGALTHDALAVLDAAGVDRAHVVGVSLGGLVAQTLAAIEPARVDHLVLVGSTQGGIHSHGVPAASLRLMAEAPALEHEELLRRLVVNALSPRTLAERPALVEEILAYRRLHAPNLGPWLSQAAAGAWFGLVGRRSPVQAPTLVLHGDVGRGDGHPERRGARAGASPVRGSSCSRTRGTSSSGRSPTASSPRSRRSAPPPRSHGGGGPSEPEPAADYGFSLLTVSRRTQRIDT